MIAKYFEHLPLNPAFAPELAVTRPVTLPVGGPYGTGGTFVRGLVLGCVGGAPADEVRTLTVGTSTGTLTTTFVADKPYVVSHAADATLAVVEAAWEAVFGAGNVTVTGTPGTSYVLTFGGVLADRRIGGLMSISSNGTAAWARTTPGSSGAGQYDVYANGSVDPAQAVLKWAYTSDPQGGAVSEHGTTLQAYSPPAYVAGYFRVADLTGFDANALADPGFRLVQGDAITDTGAVVGLGV